MTNSSNKSESSIYLLSTPTPKCGREYGCVGSRSPTGLSAGCDPRSRIPWLRSGSIAKRPATTIPSSVRQQKSCGIREEFQEKSFSLNYLELFRRYRAIRVSTQQVHGQRMTLSNLSGNQQTSRSQQLQLVPGYIADAQETVHVVDGQREDLLLDALFIAQLQHPDRDEFPHERLDVCLHVLKVITMWDCAALQQQHILHDPGILRHVQIRLGSVAIRLVFTVRTAATRVIVRQDVFLASKIHFEFVSPGQLATMAFNRDQHDNSLLLLPRK